MSTRMILAGSAPGQRPWAAVGQSRHSCPQHKVRRAAGAQNEHFHPSNEGDSRVALDSHHHRSSLASRPARQHRRRVNSPAFGYSRGRPDLPLHPRQVPRLNPKPCSAAAQGTSGASPGMTTGEGLFDSSDEIRRVQLDEISIIGGLGCDSGCVCGLDSACVPWDHQV